MLVHKCNFTECSKKIHKEQQTTARTTHNQNMTLHVCSIELYNSYTRKSLVLKAAVTNQYAASNLAINILVLKKDLCHVHSVHNFVILFPRSFAQRHIAGGNQLIDDN